jgi:Bromodomain
MLAVARASSFSSVQWAYPFNEPVDTKRYDNYLTYVKRPIDFGTIKRKLEAGGYKVPDDMHADIQQAGSTQTLMEPQLLSCDSGPRSCLCICEQLGLSWYTLTGHVKASCVEPCQHDVQPTGITSTCVSDTGVCQCLSVQPA